MKIKQITRGNSPRWPERLRGVYRRVVRKKRTRVILILSVMLVGLAGSCVMLISFVDSIRCSPRFGIFNIEYGFEPPGPYGGVQYDIGSYLDQSLEWTPDGSHIVFNTRGNYLTDSGVSSLPNSRTHVASADGSSLVSIANNGDFDITGSSTVSTDGSRIAYSTYRYVGGDTRYEDTFERYFEIETSALDGSNRRRLTERKAFDLYPTWSPSGDRIAFTRQGVPDCSLFGFAGSGRTIYVANVDGSRVHPVLKSSDVLEDGASLYIRQGRRNDRLQWSPDGRQLALFVDLGISPRGIRSRWTSLIAVEADDSGWTKLASEPRRTEVGSRLEPSTFRGSVVWSPDSRRLAFMRHEDGITTLYTLERDGSGLRAMTAPETGPEGLSGALSWSSDGSQIRFFVTNHLSLITTTYVVKADGSDLRIVGERSVDDRSQAVPSPDGSMIAVAKRGSPYHEFGDIVLYTMSPDETDVRVLARVSEYGFLEAVGPEQRPSATVASCSAGVVVADPNANPGLVRDCENLVKMVDRLAVVGLNWNADTPISEWVGVSSDVPAGPDNPRSSPARVRRLSLSGQSIRDTFPDGVTELTGLRVLDLSGTGLQGEIPSELGNLYGLRVLRLHGNELSGQIPSELGNLSALEYLDLSYNYTMGGPIPSELGSLSGLRVLRVHGNDLSGQIPSELGNLSALELLDLGGNDLSGPVPPELANLSALESLDLGGIEGLTGCIPAALAERLRANNALSISRYLPYCEE